ncbi:hypothetical protein P8631_11650 [Guyparkeria sp. 1SP6A2]|nr:hypothetical protein [Guyparkeria sp. 1SP6A2]
MTELNIQYMNQLSAELVAAVREINLHLRAIQADLVACRALEDGTLRLVLVACEDNGCHFCPHLEWLRWDAVDAAAGQAAPDPRWVAQPLREVPLCPVMGETDVEIYAMVEEALELESARADLIRTLRDVSSAVNRVDRLLDGESAHQINQDHVASQNQATRDLFAWI